MIGAGTIPNFVQWDFIFRPLFSVYVSRELTASERVYEFSAYLDNARRSRVIQSVRSMAPKRGITDGETSAHGCSKVPHRSSKASHRSSGEEVAGLEVRSGCGTAAALAFRSHMGDLTKNFANFLPLCKALS